MKKLVYTDAGAFARDTAELLSSTQALEMENNLSLGLIKHIQSGEYKDTYMMAVAGDDGRPVLAALATPPYNLILSHGDKAALRILIDDIIESGRGIPGVLGPEDMVEAFVAEWKTVTGSGPGDGLKMNFYAVTKVEMPAKKVPGVYRAAREDEVEWITDWLVRFAVDSGLGAEERKRNPEAALRKIRDGLLFVWEADGVPVSIAGYAPVTENGVRVGSVYTPPEERGKGYAAACVAELSQRMLAQGKWCSLFADMDNPVSNEIYRKIGYEERCVYKEYRF